MKIKSALFFAALFLLINACQSDEEPAAEVPHIHFENSNLEVKVRVVSDTGVVNAVGAQIRLYKSKDDRRDDWEKVHEGSTNAEGVYTFQSLAAPEYWISVKNPYDGEVKFFYDDQPFATPGHPVLLNNLDVVFE